ncbi:MAG: phage holin family protein [Micrococcaceae bacterium]
MNFVKKIFINSAALWAVTLVLSGVHLTRQSNQSIFTQPLLQQYPILANIVMFLALGLIFTLVNSFVKPIIKFLSIPFNFLTLGLFTFLINAAMLMLTAYLSHYTPVQMSIDSFVHTALPASVMISLIFMVASRIILKED